MEKEKPLLLIFPFEQLAHYLRCITLAKGLRPYFKILFSHTDRYEQFVASEGFETFCCRSLDPDYVMSCARKFDFSWINEESLQPVFADQVRVIRKYKPTVVLGDTTPTLKMAAEQTEVRCISLSNGYMSKYYAAVRKLSRSSPPYKYVKLLPEKIADFLTQKGEEMAFRMVHQPFKKLRQQNRLSSRENYLEELEGDLTLICDLPQLFPLRHLPKSYKIIPPLFYTSNSGYTNIANQLDRNKKTIFVSMGSTGDWSKVEFLNDSCFRQYNLVTAGDAANLIVGPAVIKLDFVNIHELFPFTDLVICHGGNGTIYQALLYGIPMLCKTAHFEQEWNVHRLEGVGLAKSLDEVTAIEEYCTLIKEWIEKKDDEMYSIYKNRLEETALQFDAIAREIALELFD